MKSNNRKLSAIVIAKNEEARIGRCLDSLQFADEVIVVDNSSTDKTREIAAKHGGKVISYKTQSFASLRNEAIKSAQGAWLFYIDADEVVDSTLSSNIKIAIYSQSAYTGYEVFRKNYYLGRPWPNGEWMLRLFKRDAFTSWQGIIHETPMVEGTIGRVRGEVHHDTHRSLEEMVAKTNEWSDKEAKLRLDSSHPSITWWRILRVMVTGFFDSFVRLGGWRAGTVGWIESIYQAFSMFVTYAKLWEMQQKH